VEYALEAVKKGAAVVGVRSADAVVLAVERRAAAALQDDRTLAKIVRLDENISVAFAGLNADARVLVNKVRGSAAAPRRALLAARPPPPTAPTAAPAAHRPPPPPRPQARIECQSHRLTVEDKPTVEYIARHIGTTQQRYTQRGGVRPFGLAMLLAGVDADGTPQLWTTDPSGVYAAWKANAVGRNSRSLVELLEKSYKDGCSTDEAVRLAVKALLEVVEAGAKSIEIGIMRHNAPLAMMAEADVAAVAAALEAEKAAEAAEAAGDAAAAAAVREGRAPPPPPAAAPA